VSVRSPRAVRLRAVTVRVSGRPARRRHGDRRRVRVDLRGRPAGRVVVRIEARARDGRRFAERRAYRTCARR